jgi:CRP/FNR family transcriptional regulator, cyclic AMP receptor protein
VAFNAFFDYEGTAPAQPAAPAIAFLPEIGDGEWQRLLSYTQMRRYNPGEPVMRQGETDRALYIVADGLLEWVPPDSGAGSQLPVEPVEPGAVIGELSFFDGGARTAGVRAVTECELFRLSLDAFDEMAAREPVLARMVLFDLGRILTIRLRQTSAFLAT